MTATRNIRCLVAYDGTDFSGWQVQENARTVCGVIQDALEELHGHPVSVTAAGRTDAGVHAVGQVMNFQTDSSIPGDRFLYALNGLLPGEVRILESGEVRESFNARKDATSRTYRYLIKVCEVTSPLERGRYLALRRRPDIARLNELASRIVGTRDFAVFTAAGDKSVTTSRDVFSSVFTASGACIVYTISANAFLYRMVRSIVGTVLDCEAAGQTAGGFAAILESCDRACAGPTAPPWGLYLYEVGYDGSRIYA